MLTNIQQKRFSDSNSQERWKKADLSDLALFGHSRRPPSTYIPGTLNVTLFLLPVPIDPAIQIRTKRIYFQFGHGQTGLRDVDRPP